MELEKWVLLAVRGDVGVPIIWVERVVAAVVWVVRLVGQLLQMVCSRMCTFLEVHFP